MSARSGIRREKKMPHKWLHKWFGTNRGTHWSIAGSVAVIILGCYLIYNNRDSSNSTSAATSVATERTPAR